MRPDAPLFRDLTPPPGGLQRLRARLDADDARRRRLRWGLSLGGALAGAAAALVLTLWPEPPAPAPLPMRSPALVRLGVQAPPTSPLTILPGPHAVAATPVPVADPDVLYYRVEVLAPPAPDA